MANIERASEQLNAIINGFENSNHSFVKKIIDGLSSQIEAKCDLKVVATGKEETRGYIKLKLEGQKNIANQEEFKVVDDQIRRLMDQIKGSTALIDIMG